MNRLQRHRHVEDALRAVGRPGESIVAHRDTAVISQGMVKAKGRAAMVELWLVDLAAAGPALAALEQEAPRLAAEDRRRAERLAAPRERCHRLAAYTALRIVLERAQGPDVRGAVFERSPAGKPRLATGDADFSLSHTAGLALIGVARPGTIGVDLERERKLAMSDRRREEVGAAAAGLCAEEPGEGPVDDKALLLAWCRLEAFAKARGQGLAVVLGDLGLRKSSGRALPPAAIAVAAQRLAREAGLRVADAALPRGLYGAIAVEGSARLPRLRRFPTDRAAIQRLLH
jgi:4'-phosphopantetheinyl transferase